MRQNPRKLLRPLYKPLISRPPKSTTHLLQTLLVPSKSLQTPPLQFWLQEPEASKVGMKVGRIQDPRYKDSYLGLPHLSIVVPFLGYIIGRKKELQRRLFSEVASTWVLCVGALIIGKQGSFEGSYKENYKGDERLEPFNRAPKRHISKNEDRDIPYKPPYNEAQ